MRLSHLKLLIIWSLLLLFLDFFFEKLLFVNFTNFKWSSLLSMLDRALNVSIIDLLFQNYIWLFFLLSFLWLICINVSLLLNTLVFGIGNFNCMRIFVYLCYKFILNIQFWIYVAFIYLFFRSNLCRSLYWKHRLSYFFLLKYNFRLCWRLFCFLNDRLHSLGILNCFRYFRLRCLWGLRQIRHWFFAFHCSLFLLRFHLNHELIQKILIRCN